MHLHFWATLYIMICAYFVFLNIYVRSYFVFNLLLGEYQYLIIFKAYFSNNQHPCMLKGPCERGETIDPKLLRILYIKTFHFSQTHQNVVKFLTYILKIGTIYCVQVPLFPKLWENFLIQANFSKSGRFPRYQ